MIGSVTGLQVKFWHLLLGVYLQVFNVFPRVT
jgi:hypothetical protein